MKKKILIVAVVIILVIAGGVYYWTTSKPEGGVPSAEVESILSKLGTHMLLPSGETPQIGQIDDPVEGAKTQPFIAGAVKGDLLIVYVKAAKAIVYSPSRDIIVNVGPVSMDSEESSTPAEVSTTSAEKNSD